VRRFRKIIDKSIPIVGMVIVFLAVTLISDFNMQARIATVLVGVLMIEAGVWKLTSPFLQSQRDYVELRAEVDGFILLVRSLNEAALGAREAGTDESWLALRKVSDAMHESVDHMTELAGKAEGSSPTDVPSAGEA